MKKKSKQTETNFKKNMLALAGLKKYAYGFVTLNGVNFLLVAGFCSFLALKLDYINFNQALLIILAYVTLFFVTMQKFVKKMLNSYITTEKKVL